MSPPSWVLFALLWVSAGITTVVLVLYRRGHRERVWLLIGGALGPLLLPIALERASRRPRRWERRGQPDEERAGHRQLCALVGIDGSPESAEAVRATARLLAPVPCRVVLATVVSADAADTGRDDQLAAARDLVSRHRVEVPEGTMAVETRIVEGQPADALRELADAEDADLIVVGRGGTGFSRMVLGSAARSLTTSAGRPVLVVPRRDAPPP